jgi:hypothetical protein
VMPPGSAPDPAAKPLIHGCAGCRALEHLQNTAAVHIYQVTASF